MKFINKITRQLLAFLFVFAAVSPACAAGNGSSLKEVVSALEKGYSTLQDVHADFSQKTVITSIGKTQRGNGEVFLKRPGSATAMFRFNYSKPSQQIVSNGKQVWFYLPENKQVLVSSVAGMFKGSNGIALTYLTGLGHVSRDFGISFAKEQRDKNGNYQIVLIPKKPTPVLAKLHLTIAAEAVDSFVRSGEVRDIFPIVSSVVFDAGSNETRIDYSRARVNKGIDNSRFSFRTPAGVEVIKQ